MISESTEMTQRIMFLIPKATLSEFAFRQSENTRTFFAISFLLAIVLHDDSCILRSGNVFFGTTLSSNFLLNTITTQHCGCAFGARATYLIAYKDLASPGLTFIFPLLLIAKNLLRS